MKYRDYQLQDFLCDENFIRSVQNPTPESIAYWEGVLVRNNHLLTTYAVARDYVLLFEAEPIKPPLPDTADRVWEKIDGRTSEYCAAVAPKKKRRKIFCFVKVAAVSALLFPSPGQVTAQAVRLPLHDTLYETAPKPASRALADRKITAGKSRHWFRTSEHHINTNKSN